MSWWPLNNRKPFVLLQQWLGAKYAPEFVTLLGALIVTIPLWVVERPPLQDLPQHVAAVRVLSSYWDQSFRFAEYFELTLGRTQYLTVYLLAAPLAKLCGPLVATKLVLTGSLVATPYCLVRLLRAIGLSAWLGLVALPLVFNVHVAFGFLNFVAGIPVLFWGLELACLEYQKSERKRQIGLALVLLLAFFSHVVPFGVLLFCVLLLIRFEPRAVLRQALVVLPSLAVAGFWLAKSPAGQVVASMGRQNSTSDSPPSYQAFGAALRSVPEWLIDISTADQDDVRLAVWLIVVLVSLVLAATLPEASKASGVGARQLSDDAPFEPRVLRGRVVVGLVVPLSLIAYVTLPTASGFIWPICQRFPLLAALFVVPLLGRAPALARAFAAVVSIALALLATAQYSQLFRQVEAIAYRGFDHVVARIPLGSRVATLVFDRNVDGLRLSPLMHAAGWVQAERGGMVMFTFAEFPPSPFSYRPSRRPPQVPPRWEWVPDRVRPDRDLGWYDFVLVHGWTGSLEASRRFVSVFEEGRWSLWRRADSARKFP